MARIVIFDSGVGGLSIHQAVSARLPLHEYIFVSDTFAYPYGTKESDELIPRVHRVVQRIVDHLQPDIVIIACNTASTVVLPTLRERYSLPFVGVVPAIKPAALQSNSKVIGLLATPATIARNYTQQLIAEFAADCKVVTVGSTKLVAAAEQKLRGEAPSLAQIKLELAPLVECKAMDVLVLACTHFPLLINEIRHIIDVEGDYEGSAAKVAIIDSGAAIAKRVGQLLQDHGLTENGAGSASSGASFTTSDIAAQTALCQTLANRKLPFQGMI